MVVRLRSLRGLRRRRRVTSRTVSPAMAGARRKKPRTGWPYVERIAECESRPAWLVDDGGARIVVVGGLVWRPEDLVFAAPHLRTAAAEAVARLERPAAMAS